MCDCSRNPKMSSLSLMAWRSLFGRPCNACTHGFCDLCRKTARSDVQARKSCSNVPSRFLPATENKIMNQENPGQSTSRNRRLGVSRTG
jgi:hypothetical protein